MPLFFVDEPAAFTGLISIASEGAVPLNIGNFSINTPGILVGFFSHGLPSFKNCASRSSIPEDILCSRNKNIYFWSFLMFVIMFWQIQQDTKVLRVYFKNHYGRKAIVNALQFKEMNSGGGGIS